MPHSFGYRARTRDLFSKGFRKNGTIATQRFLKTYRLGDIVDVKADSAIQKGMPHKYYHGKTGIVWNVTKRAIGVEMNKKVGGRYMRKRIHVRVEHVQHSKCRKEFLDRVKRNAKQAEAAKKSGKKVSLKREPALQPKPARTINVKSSNNSIETLEPEEYMNLFV